jgi:hypothetical protein
VLKQSLPGLAPDADPPPTVLFWLPGQSEPLGFVIAVPSEFDQRCIVIDALRLAAAALKAHAVVTILSGWESSSAAGRPSQAPDRREVLIITSESSDDAGGLTLIPIQRQKDGPPVLMRGHWLPASGGDDNAVKQSPWLGLLRPEMASNSPSAHLPVVELGSQITQALQTLLAELPNPTVH